MAVTVVVGGTGVGVGTTVGGGVGVAVGGCVAVGVAAPGGVDVAVTVGVSLVLNSVATWVATVASKSGMGVGAVVGPQAIKDKTNAVTKRDEGRYSSHRKPPRGGYWLLRQRPLPTLGPLGGTGEPVPIPVVIVVGRPLSDPDYITDRGCMNPSDWTLRTP